MSVQSKATELFGVRDKTNRAKLINYLFKNKGVEKSISEVSRAVYGKAAKAESSKRKLAMVVVGLQDIIDSKKLKFEIRRENGSIGLFDKGSGSCAKRKA